MVGERTQEGFEVRLVVRDPIRWVSATFLSFWLCGWAVGEGVALYILFRGGWALLTGAPIQRGHPPLQVGAAMAVGAFLLLWLSLWTLGGIAAIGELLRLLFGRDRLVAANGRLTVTWSRGPFARSRTFEHDAIGRILLLPPRDILALEAGGRRVELSRLGTAGERAEAAAALRTELMLSEAPAAGRLPERWEEIVTPEGERAVVPNLATRRAQTRTAIVFALLAATVTYFVARDVPRHVGLMVPALMGLIVTAALVAGAVWLARGRKEWRIGSGRLTVRKRFGADVRDEFEARRLVLDSVSDSDGDLSFVLYAVGEDDGAPPPLPPRTASQWLPAAPRNSRELVRLTNEPQMVRDLATWLSRAASIEVEDRTTPDARAAQLAAFQEQLEKAGPLGKMAAKWITRLAK